MKDKLLLISAISPFPKDSGGSVRIWNTLDNLSKYFDIVFVFFKAHEYELSKQETKWLEEKVSSFYFFNLFDERNLNYFFSYGQPFWFTPWYDDEFKLFIKQLINKEKIKIVQIEFTQLLYLVDLIPKGIKTVFTAHDVSSVSFLRRAKEVCFSKKKLFFFVLWLQVLWYELKYLSKFDVVVAMSNIDKNILEKKFKTKKTLVVPNGINNVKINKTKFIKINKNQPIKLGYIGPFSHPPNEMAVRFFINKISPLLETNNVDYIFYYAGKSQLGLIEEIINKANLKYPRKIVNLGFVKEVDSFYNKIDCLITPIFSGSGTRLKIIEALSYGISVISTKIGSEGIEVDSSQLKIANNKKDFLREIKTLKAKLLLGIENNNKDIQEKYSWSNSFKFFAKNIKD